MILLGKPHRAPLAGEPAKLEVLWGREKEKETKNKRRPVHTSYSVSLCATISVTRYVLVAGLAGALV